LRQGNAIDVVYTWVDDRWPGYHEELARFTEKPADSDPSRTRDNLDLMRYSLRSLERALPDLGTVYFLTCRPQVPEWLDTSHPKIRVVHHDQIMSAEILPTFNSLAIISHLHLLPGLSERFLYFDDDILLTPSFEIRHLETDDGKFRIYPWKYWVPRPEEIRNPADQTPWNLALAETARLCDRAFGTRARRQVCHMPLLIDKASWQRVMESHDEVIARTRGSRFRSGGNVDPQHLFQWTMLGELRAVLEDENTSRRTAGYVPLEDVWPVTFLSLLKARQRRLRWVCFNDNFGPRPSRVTEWMVRRHLQASYPEPSSFERR